MRPATVSTAPDGQLNGADVVSPQGASAVIAHPSAPRRPLGALCFNVRTLTRNAHHLLLALASFGNLDKPVCEARRRNLQKALHWSESTFYRALSELGEIGAVLVVERWGAGGRRAGSHYTLTPENAPQIEWPQPQPTLAMGPTPMSRVTGGAMSQVTDLKEQERKEYVRTDRNPPVPPTTGTEPETARTGPAGYVEAPPATELAREKLSQLRAAKASERAERDKARKAASTNERAARQDGCSHEFDAYSSCEVCGAMRAEVEYKAAPDAEPDDAPVAAGRAAGGEPDADGMSA